jgi:hypothetical protein
MVQLDCAIFLVDAADPQRFREAKEELNQLATHILVCIQGNIDLILQFAD